MRYRRVFLIMTVINLMMNCSFFIGSNEIRAAMNGTRGNELFSISFPDAVTDQNDNDYITMDAGVITVVKFKLNNELASGQDFQLQLENITSWPIAFDDSSDNITMFVAGHSSAKGNIWVNAYDPGEKIIFINVSLGNKYVSKQLKLISLPLAISLAANMTEAFVDAGGKADIRITIHNHLPETDTLALSMTRTLTQGTGPQEKTWVGELDEGSLVIPGESMRNVTLTVYAPIIGEPGEKVVAGLVAQSTNRDKEYTISIDVVIRSNYEMTVHTIETEKTAGPGDSVQFEAKITNSGNDVIEVDITPSIPDGWKSPPLSKILATGQYDDIIIRIEIAPKALAGRYSIKVNFSADSGIWDVVPLNITVLSVTNFSVEKRFGPSGILYPGEFQRSAILIKSECNHDQAMTLVINNQSQGATSYFRGIGEDLDGTYEPVDFNSQIDLAELNGTIRALADQKVSELNIVLGPFQEISFEVLSELNGPPFPEKENIDVSITCRMGSVNSSLVIPLHVKSTDIRITVLNVDGKQVGEDTLVELSEDSKHTVTVVLRNELAVMATDVEIIIYIDGGPEVDSFLVKEIAPNTTLEVELSWETKSRKNGEEELLSISIKDSSGREIESDWIEIHLVESEGEDTVSIAYVILTIVFIIAITIFMIYVIKTVKKGKEEKEREHAKGSGRKDAEIDDFFSSDRRTYYSDADYESMGTENVEPEKRGKRKGRSGRTSPGKRRGRANRRKK